MRRRRQWQAPAETPVLDPEAAQLGEHAEVDREDLPGLAPLLYPEESHHRQGVEAVAERGKADGVWGQPDRDPSSTTVNHLEPDNREQPDGSRPASQRLGIGEMGGALAGNCGKCPADRPADRPPRIEGPENISEDHTEQREAEPNGDVDEGRCKVPIWCFGAVETGIDRECKQEDPDRAKENLHGQAQQHP